MHGALIEWRLRDGVAEAYAPYAREIAALAARMPGFISETGFRSEHGDGPSLSLSYWTDAEAITNWRQDPDHQVAIARGKDEFFSWFRITIFEMQRQYDFDTSRPEDDRLRYLLTKPGSVATAPIEARVVEAELIARGVRKFRFELDEPVDAEAGAHVEIFLAEGLSRTYSVVVGESRRRSLMVAVKLDPQGRGSRHLHEEISVGDRMRIGRPRNNFPLQDGPEPVVLIAGGIGITPIIGMARAMQQAGRPFDLHYATGFRAEMAFVDELETEDFATLYHTRETSQPMDIAAIVNAMPPDAHVYACGPSRMIDALLAATAHLPAGRVHIERFVAGTGAAREGGFTVEATRSGRSVLVEAGETVAAALLRVGVPIATSCGMGICGTCRTRIVAGLPDHRDSVLTDEERASGQWMTPCCSGSFSKTLALDL